MADYKELIEKFRAKRNDGWQKDGSYQEQIITVQDILDAADAIERLVKERDAAVADLKRLDINENGGGCCYSMLCSGKNCANFDGDGNDCWEWRGLQENGNER